MGGSLGSVTVFAGDPGVVVADHLLPASGDQGGLAEVVRDHGGAVAAQPDIGLACAVGWQDQQQAAGHFRGLAAAQVGAGFQP
ncbi:hypothetical protein D3C76_1057450 [compost metagenome]